ncbi:helix-turn-helix domain-containing protein [Vibrio europaeus]|uniref:helix-turn-helix domain-containing protein n=1 Tax=Vibrio europaeus TaxID=300876 RepID=UPI00233E585D|nr:helix-turn-helix transcriptional regulator [Vibrio europaeus]MDC5753578.1 helix-turn-helix domain-containing protein [Vibrio europaeus]MDC5816509.1 helix-turn-helix domain-containing protein [Vibrio europaeus]
MNYDDLKNNNRHATIRLLSNLTQQQQADELGCSRDLISKWETGERKPSESAKFAAQALHFMIDNDLLEQFKDHRHNYQNLINKGLTTDQIKMLINLSPKT